ncbi:hypothetical protein C8R43DRAFT_1131820 [Mycena crocata]|nr:hypothetical protein C8R43DRAFT_1131820 [Mycena crocata]
MFSKLVALTCILNLSVAAPLPVLLDNWEPLLDTFTAAQPAKRSTDGPFTDANGYRCTQHYTARPGDTCFSVSAAFGLRPAILINMNPEIGEYCTAFAVGTEYCVQTVMSDNQGHNHLLNGF